MKISPARLKSFREKVYAEHRLHGRKFLWRRTHNPYHILVSEIMLQQTQANRAELFFSRFISAFPNIFFLSRARTLEVIRLWKGLGYNRRALFLHRTAREIVSRHGGIVPRSVEELEQFRGVGPYTARAICAFAFNEPVVFIETNIRTAHLFHFFSRRRQVTDREILDVVSQTFDKKNPRLWYQALMDYGAMLKVSHRLNQKSAHYVPQKKFKGSRRELRGKILALALEKNVSVSILERSGLDRGFSKSNLKNVLTALVSEGFLKKKGLMYRLI